MPPEERFEAARHAALELFQRATKAEAKARFDGLTGLRRNHILEGDLKYEFEKRRDPAYQRGAMSGFYADIDHFKIFNDQYGHETGDEVLASTGRILREEIERAVKEGKVAKGAYAARRYDRGEELVGIFPGTEAARVRGVIEKIRQRLSELVVSAGGGSASGGKDMGRRVKEAVTMSIGLAEVGDDDTLDRFLGKIERAAKYAKEELGRNAVADFSEKIDAWAEGKVEPPREAGFDPEAIMEETEREEEALPVFRSDEEPPASIRNAITAIREQAFYPSFPDPDAFLAMLKKPTDGEKMEALLFYQRIVEERAKHLERLSSEDALTGVENRSTLMDRLEQELQIAQQERREKKEGEPREVSVLLVDLDFFKKVNDTYGNKIADGVLRDAGKILRDFTKENKDIIASTGRSGGEEFVVILPATKKSDAMKVAERLRSEFEGTKMDLPGGREHRQTLSVGVASTSDFDPDEPLSVNALLQKADMSVYRSKADGRNRATAYSPEVQRWYEEEQEKRRKKTVVLLR